MVVRQLENFKENLMENSGGDFRRMVKLATLGFHSGPPYMKKYLYCQMIFGSVFFIFYIYYNGGKWMCSYW